MTSSLASKDSDPTIILELGGRVAHTASLLASRQGGANPDWGGEEFEFTEVDSDAELIITLVDAYGGGIGGHGNAIGWALVPVKELVRRRRFVGCLPLRAPGGKLGGRLPRAGEERGLGSGEGGGRAGGGVVELDVRVEGGWYDGEQEMLGALRAMGLEKHNIVLKEGGLRTISDLLHPLAAEQLAFRCPALDEGQVESVVRRLEAGRRGGFMSKEAQLLATRITAWAR